MLQIGDAAPAFRLASTAGREVALADLAGKRVVLYFYPRDDTPGCTREACAFRDQRDAFAEHEVVVFGVSKDAIAAHERFRAKYDLSFDLLSDPTNEVARAYGAFGEKTSYGKTVTGSIRSTFVIGPDGKIEHRWSPVKVDGHAEKVLAAIASGGGSAAGRGKAQAKPKAKVAKAAAKSKPRGAK